MVSDTLDTLDENEMFEDDEAEAEVNNIISEITGNKITQETDLTLNLPSVEEKAPASKNAPVAQSQEDDEDEELLNNMRERLKALQS